MNVSLEDIDDLIKLAQLLYTEEGRVDITGIADVMLEILNFIKTKDEKEKGTTKEYL